MTAASDLGSLQTRLQGLLERAKERKEQAEASCGDSDTRGTRKLLKQAFRRMVEVVRTLRSKRARKSIPAVLREALLEAADGVRGDLRTLKQSVACPDDVG